MPDGTYLPDPGIRSVLAKAGTGYTLTTPSLQVDTFDAGGRLVSMVDRTGRNRARLYRHAAHHCDRRREPPGDSVLRPNLKAALNKVALADGRSIGYGYDTAGWLAKVTDLNGQNTVYAYATARPRG